ncbi:MAG: glycosyltransferase [Solirubrobacterales bacterium]|nr:glycosyltransferase [Solirubrobacterales bacterium]
MRISVIVPALDEEREVDAVLDHLCDLDGLDEVVVADGGSTDGTTALARAHPARAVVVEARGVRPALLNAGAAAASGDVLVFLRPGSRLPLRAAGSLRAAAARTGVVGGDFTVRFAGTDPVTRALGLLHAAQRRIGVYDGTSALWCRRDAFDALGGFRAREGGDGYDFVRRLEARGRTACLPGPVTTPERPPVLPQAVLSRALSRVR